MLTNLRRIRILAALQAEASVSRAAKRINLSQPAVSQALSQVERGLGITLYDRGPQGLAPTPAGRMLGNRITRALGLLDPRLCDLSPRLPLTATTAQLRAVIAVTEAESFSEAARRLGLAQPSIHRAVTQIEAEVGHPIFDRTPHGVKAHRLTRALATAAQLAMTELAQAQSELAELSGRDIGCIVVGAMPLSRSCLMAPAILRMKARRPDLRIRVVDGPFRDLALGLRRGEIDMLLGALRPDEFVPDLRQEPLFEDIMLIVARPGHPANAATDLVPLQASGWVVAAEGTPSRRAFDAMFAPLPTPSALIETGSIVLMREILMASDHLGFASRLQVDADLRSGQLIALPLRPANTRRPIGILQRANWQPTRIQQELMDDLRQCGQEIAQRHHPDAAASGSGARVV
ncbi:LysR family transcriptional regulator [Natronohydrobacter thiooxidans]|uniref:LysR family transcriptional regulator n=1 Tax=Natronohydrobacter thiooxidans TaxID=87172 RepID=UPI0008FF094E|nr:LysR family transcriptional regulator [Natronohydrobacter thiooxidans]